MASYGPRARAAMQRHNARFVELCAAHGMACDPFDLSVGGDLIHAETPLDVAELEGIKKLMCRHGYGGGSTDTDFCKDALRDSKQEL